MAYEMDYPDYHPGSTPGVVRWAPGTEFGAIAYDNTIAAGVTQVISYSFPDDGYFYVIDKVFCWRDNNGVTPFPMSVCPNIALPVWTIIGLLEMDQSIDMTPFTMVSMVMAYPMAIKWDITNPCNSAKWYALHATMYRYLVV